MAVAGMRMVAMPPGGTRSIEALRRAMPATCLVTSFDDARLRLLKDQIQDDTDSLEFISFGEAVGRFLLCLGASTGRMCTRGRETSLVGVWSAELGEDSALGRSLRYPGAAEVVSEVLHELRDWGWNAAELEKAMESVSPAFRRRLEDMAFLESHIESRLEGTSLQFAAHRAKRCMELQANARLPFPELLVVVGDEDRPVFEQWLQWAARQGVRVSVALDASEAHPKMFAGARRIADRLGVQWESDKEPHWTDALFSDGVAADAPHVEFWQAPDMLAECETALRHCIKRQQEGVFPFRIGIYARDAESYAPLLIAAAERLGVPLKASITAPLMTNGFARLVLQTLEGLASDDVRTLSRVASSGYLGLATANRNELKESLAQAFRSREEQWQKLATWAENAGEAFDWLRHILTWRAEVQEPCSLGGWLDRLRSLIGGTVFVDWAVDESPTQAQDLYAQTVLHRSLAEHAFAYDARMGPASLQEFAQIARQVWEQANSTLPGQTDGVVFASNSCMLGELDTLYVLGLLEGVMPRRRTENPLLGDGHRAELSAAAPHLVPLLSSHERIHRERDEFMRLCATPTSHLVLSYPKTSDDQDNVPAFYLSEVRRALQGRYQDLDLPRRKVVPDPEDCVAPRDFELARALQEPAVPPTAPELTAPEAFQRVRPTEQKPATLEEAEKVRTCAFQAAARYRLRLFESESRLTVHRMVGLPIEAGLASQPTPEMAHAALKDALEEFVAKRWAELEAWEVRILRIAGESLIQGWVEREFVARKLWREGRPAERANITFDQLVEGRRANVTGAIATMASASQFGGSSLIGDTWVLQQYVATSPELSLPKQGPKEELLHYWLMAGALCQCGPHKGVKRVAFDIDSTNGTRHLLCIPLAKDLPSQRPDYIVPPVPSSEATDSERRKQFWAQATASFQEAKERLERSTMCPEATFDGCKQCRYKQLCRSSWDHIQTDSEVEE